MKFGCCATWDKARAVADAGYDYIEPPVAGALKPESPWDSTPFAAASACPLIPEAFNVMLPRDLAIVGPEVDGHRVQRYLETAFLRLDKVGARLVVFGSGRSRRVPDGFPREKAREQIEGFLRSCASLAATYGLIVAVEPLNSGECNIINSVIEGMRYVRAVDASAVGVLCDLYHVDREGQSYLDIREAGEALRHVHVAGRENRRIPTHADLDYLTSFFRVLKHSGYSERISIEAGAVTDVAEAATGLEILRRAWSDA